MLIWCDDGNVVADADSAHPMSLVAQTVKRLSTMRETWVRSLGWEDPLEKEKAIHSIFLPEKSYGQRNLAGLLSTRSQSVGHD